MNVDWDLLADHLGGALEGTPAAAEVTRLVSTDPHWARAAAELAVAFDMVAADLRALPSPSLPDDVALRLESAVGAAVPATQLVATGAPASRPPAAAPPAGRSTSEQRHPPARPGTRKRRRMVGWGTGFTVAAGLAAIAVLGLTALELDQPLSDIVAGGGEDGSDSEADARAPATAPEGLDVEPEPRGTGGAAPVVVATGTEYDAPMLATNEPGPPPAPGSPQLGGAEDPTPAPAAPEFGINTEDVPEQVPPSLERLWVDPEARAECLEMVRDSVEPDPVRIDTVDFAMYQGEEALVIWLTTSDALRRAVIAGPECGTADAGPDFQFQTQVP